MGFKGILNMANVEKLGTKIRTFVKMDNSGSLGIDKSIRIKVKVDVRRPLVKVVKVKLRGGLEESFDVKYEHPRLYCFYCGKMGHGIKDCEEYRDVEEPMNHFGEWLKSSPWKIGRI